MTCTGDLIVRKNTVYKDRPSPIGQPNANYKGRFSPAKLFHLGSFQTFKMTAMVSHILKELYQDVTLSLQECIFSRQSRLYRSSCGDEKNASRNKNWYNFWGHEELYYLSWWQWPCRNDWSCSGNDHQCWYLIFCFTLVRRFHRICRTDGTYKPRGHQIWQNTTWFLGSGGSRDTCQCQTDIFDRSAEEFAEWDFTAGTAHAHSSESIFFIFPPKLKFKFRIWSIVGSIT